MPPEVTEGREEGWGESLTPLFSSPLPSSSPFLSSLPLSPPTPQRSLLCSVQSLSYRRPSTVPFLTVRMCNSYFTPGSPATATVAVRGGSAATGLVQMFIPSTPLPLFPSPPLSLSPSKEPEGLVCVSFLHHSSSPTLTPSPYHPPILPFSHIHPSSLTPSHT